jgi:hypothetical protein
MLTRTAGIGQQQTFCIKGSNLDFSFLGDMLLTEDVEKLRHRLTKMVEPHRIPGRMDCIPIACQFLAAESSNRFEEGWFAGEEAVVAFFENYNVMVLTKVKAVLSLLSQREPWQDWDICLFDWSVTWCAAITHNDEVKFLRFAPT